MSLSARGGVPKLIRQRGALFCETTVSRFDKINSALISSILIVGFVVLLLFVVWAAAPFSTSKERLLLDPELIICDTSHKDAAAVDAELGQDVVLEQEQPLVNALESVTDAVSKVHALSAEPDGMTKGVRRGKPIGIDDDEIGPEANRVPDWERWRIEYAAESKADYAAQLDSLGVIIGAVHLETAEISLVSSIREGGKVAVVDRATMSPVLRFAHRKPRMRHWDDQFCEQAGIEMDRRATCQFYPDAVRDELRRLEQIYLGEVDVELEAVRRTRFQVVPAGAGYEFRVAEVLLNN